MVGSTQGYANGVLRFTDVLPANPARGNAGYLAMLDAADAYVAHTGLDLLPEPAAPQMRPDSACVTDPLQALGLAWVGVMVIIWTTGFRQDFGRLRVDTFGPDGAPSHHRGVAAVPGVYFLSLPWQTLRASSFIWGVWRDAQYIAGHIATYRRCQVYRPGVGRR